MITVVNKHTHIPTPDDVYIGRGSPLGNPYTSINYMKTKADVVCDSREDSLNQYFNYITIKIKQKDSAICYELNRIYKLVKDGKNVNLVCYCVPKACHGNIVKKIIEDKIDKHKTYKGKFNALKDNQIAVVGTNTQGRHGKGFALMAKEKFGAINGQARGLQGRCYGIITKDLTKKEHPSRTSEQIKEEIQGLYDFANKNKQLEFVVSYNCEDTNLNAYSSKEMAEFFSSIEIPDNMLFEAEFYKLIKKGLK